LKHWYAESHGEGDLELCPFVPFFIDHLPGSFKRYRQYMYTITQQPNAITQSVAVLLFLSYYMRVRDSRGVLYEMIAARDAGITRQQVLNVIEFTFLTSGPSSANAMAHLGSTYFEQWDPSGDDEATADWPSGWTLGDGGAHRSSFDFMTAALSEDDWSVLTRWYRLAGQEIPSYVQFLAKWRGDMLKVVRHRQEHMYANLRLPIQMLPLFTLHQGVIECNRRAVREGAVAARRVGVTKEQVVQTVLWAFLHGSEPTLNDVSEELDPILEAWS